MEKAKVQVTSAGGGVGDGAGSLSNLSASGNDSGLAGDKSEASPITITSLAGSGSDNSEIPPSFFDSYSVSSTPLGEITSPLVGSTSTSALSDPKPEITEEELTN